MPYKLAAVLASERGHGNLSCMQVEQAFEELRPAGEGMNRSTLEGRPAIHGKQHARHMAGRSGQPAMSLLVQLRFASSESMGQQQRLPEGNGKALAGDGIYGAGGIASQKNAPLVNSREPTIGGYRSAHSGDHGCALQPLRQRTGTRPTRFRTARGSALPAAFAPAAPRPPRAHSRALHRFGFPSPSTPQRCRSMAARHNAGARRTGYFQGAPVQSPHCRRG